MTKHDARLNTLIEMSRSLGEPGRDYIILGEGNTSAGADDDSFYVKASGTSLVDIHADGFVRVSREKARELLSADTLSDEQVAEGLEAASIDAAGRRPSVETFLHALLLDLPGIEFIGHTHPTPVNALLCSIQAEEMVRGRLFPDEVVCCGPESAYVHYTDPGLPLAKAVGEAVEDFIERWNEPPKIIMMQSHGMIAMAETPAQVLSATAMAVKAARARIGAATCGGIRTLCDGELERIYTRPDEHYRRDRLRDG